MRFLLSALAALTILVGGSSIAAAAEPPVTCPPGQTPINSTCVIVVEGPGGPGTTDPGGGGDGGGNGGGGGDNGPRVCYAGDIEVDCENHFGVYVDGCYIRAADPQPPKSDPVWEGNDEGVIVECTPYPCVPQPGQNMIADCTSRNIYWAAAPPAAPVISPQELADRAVAAMGLGAGEIGIAPPADRGVVGVPVWLWVANAGASTTGPLDESASAGGVTVTARAELDRIVYDMGDGNQVTCVGGGTPFSSGQTTSPDCGYTYERSSAGRPGDAYTVTATSYWTVEWNGGNQNGVIPLEFSRSVDVRVGELQALVTD